MIIKTKENKNKINFYIAHNGKELSITIPIKFIPGDYLIRFRNNKNEHWYYPIKYFENHSDCIKYFIENQENEKLFVKVYFSKF